MDFYKIWNSRGDDHSELLKFVLRVATFGLDASS